MGLNHYQACVPYSDVTANISSGVSYDSSVVVYDTMFSYPSTGLEYYVDNIEDNGDITGMSSFNNTGSTSGIISCLAEDWLGGGPASATSSRWQTTYQGLIYGGVKSDNSVSIKVIYSGSVKLSVDSDNVVYTGTGDLDDVLLDDWVLDNSSSVVKVYEDTVITTASASTYGVLPFRIRYWNSTDIPHLIVKIKRHGIDSDYVLLATSCVTNQADHDYNLNPSSINDGCSNSVLPDVLSWNVSRSHDSITVATINAYIENTSDNNSYNTNDESYGSIRKGQLISIHAGYDGTMSKRFVGNVTGGMELSRDKHGSVVSFKCEGVMALMLDTKNYNFPNNASYSLAEYFAGDYEPNTPNGVTRPAAYDKWNITTAVKTLALQSGIDPIYLEASRKYYGESMSVVDSDYNLMRDYNIFLSSKLISEFEQVNVNISLEEAYIWTYDFGQDSAYDMAKDMLKKYGFYMGELNAGDDCGSLQIIEMDTPLSITESIDSGVSYTENILKEHAEGFRVTELADGVSSVVFNWTGKSASVIIPRDPSFTAQLYMEYKVASSDIDWTAITGTYNLGSFTGNSYVSPKLVDTTTELHYYNGTNNNDGGNATVYNIVFGVDDNGDIRSALPYGDHQLRFYKTAADICYIDSIITYDYDLSPYKRYSTDSLIQSLSVSNNIPDIRNDIVVLGASSAGFSHTADDEDLVEVSNKFITSRAVDHRSIYDKSYKYYIGRDKKFIIEDPTIVTQERADWLANYVLEEYRQTSRTASIKIPADSGLQVYNAITIKDAKTGVINEDLLLSVTSVSESYSHDGYTMDVGASSRSIPPSFRGRQLLTPEELSLYFNNCPIAFEKITVPIKGDNTAYDPMTSDDGQYINIEWTQLVPGIVSIEVYDTYATERVGIIGTANHLIAVPYLNTEMSSTGKYSVLWDGVNEGWDLNDKFKGTVYETVHELPDGHGFFARGQDTLLVDQVDPIAVEVSNERAAKVNTFPLFLVCNYTPVSNSYNDVASTYMFGTQNGTSSYNGVDNSSNDISALDIKHFQLSERISVVWGFDEEYINYPTDGTSFNRNYIDPHSVADKFAVSELYTQDFIDNHDISHNAIYFDTKKPYGYDGTWSTYDETKSIYTMPVIDETVGVKIFTDSTYAGSRKFYIRECNFIYTVVTVVTDIMNFNVTRFHTWTGNSNMKRVQNYIFKEETETGQPIVDLKNTEQFIQIGEWINLPTYTDRSSTDSLLFRGNLSQVSKTQNSGLSGANINPGSTIPGLGVGKNLAISPENIENFSVGNVPNILNSDYYIPYRIEEEWVTQTRPWATHLFMGLDSDTHVYTSDLALYLMLLSGSQSYIMPTSNYTGVSTLDRKVYNTVLVSLDVVVVDRAGRAYYSLAKKDIGQFQIGNHNNVRVSGQHGLEMMKYVNRYDPYLPTACYMERGPGSLPMTEFGGGFTGLYDTSRVGYVIDYTGMNLSEKVINYVTTDFGDTVKATTPNPVVPIHLYTANYPSLVGLPKMVAPHSASGQDSMYFGSIENKYNSYVYVPTGVDSGHSRTYVPTPALGPYGIPLYISGGHTCGNTNLYSSYPNNPYIDRYKWTQNYIKDNYDEQGQGDEVTHQRSGLWSWINNMPVFTLIGGAKLTKVYNT